MTTPPLTMNVILASTSPRRQQLLSLAEIEFVTYGVNINEEVHSNELPDDYIVRMVSAKAKAAIHSIINMSELNDENLVCHNMSIVGEPSQETQSDFSLIITADTIGVLGDRRTILMKPKDKADAFTMWSKMSDTEHTIWTAVQLTVVDAEGNVIEIENILEKTDVTFIALNQLEMERYWETGEPQDKAGGYAIQGRGAAWVERINGSYTNVVGLPLAQTLSAIHRINQKINKLS